MRKTVAGFLLGGFILFISCGKASTSGCQPVPVANEKGQLVNFCIANNINYTEHSSGLLYQIITPGTGSAPTVSSTVSVLYTARFLTGVAFDSSTNVASPFSSVLNNLIDGWKIGIPLISKGGHIKLILPSALAYSCGGYPPVVPANTPLYFDVTLVDFK